MDLEKLGQLAGAAASAAGVAAGSAAAGIDRLKVRPMRRSSLLHQIHLVCCCCASRRCKSYFYSMNTSKCLLAIALAFASKISTSCALELSSHYELWRSSSYCTYCTLFFFFYRAIPTKWAFRGQAWRRSTCRKQSRTRYTRIQLFVAGVLSTPSAAAFNVS